MTWMSSLLRGLIPGQSHQMFQMSTLKCGREAEMVLLEQPMLAVAVAVAVVMGLLSRALTAMKQLPLARFKPTAHLQPMAQR